MALSTRFFKDGKTKVLTMSYDDGMHLDREVVEIMNSYGVRGTFHLNSGSLSDAGGWNIKAEEVTTLYKNQEVSVHTVSHPNPNYCTKAGLANEILDDKRTLEGLCGYPVRGMSYPFGAYNDSVIEIAKACGMEYSRTVNSTHNFSLPSDFMQWHPTCHQSDGMLMELAEKFVGKQNPWESYVFYVWGHSFEFNNNLSLDLLKNFFDVVARRDDVWYATNIEIVDYVKARESLRVSADESMVYNPSAVSVWVGRGDEVFEVKSGQTLKL
jgi:peptidoglycan/xylan/chitin deacetylase (PgdA/CDA1 family)